MAKSKEQKWWDSLNPIEQYKAGHWFGAELMHQGNPLDGGAPTSVVSHPNEIATANQIRAIIARDGEKAGLAKAKEIGLDLRHLDQNPQ